ncbi:MAG: hypothetical protein PHC80_00885, partial [Eubacteriales bacterium]|nr:hypothetical protein [Eubacteriales bacterium]
GWKCLFCDINNNVPITVRTSRQIASGLDAFFEAAAYGDEAAALFAAVMQTPFTVAISGGIPFELVISACVWAHIGDLPVELKTE